MGEKNIYFRDNIPSPSAPLRLSGKISFPLLPADSASSAGKLLLLFLLCLSGKNLFSSSLSPLFLFGIAVKVLNHFDKSPDLPVL